jgi:hypothetical protein
VVVTLVVTSTSTITSVKSESFDVASTMFVSTPPPSVVYQIMEREERDRHDVVNRRHAQYEADYGHPEGPVPNSDQQPRSQIVAAAQDDVAAQVGDNGDDMAITAFPALASRSTTAAPTPTSGCQPTISL